MFIKNYLTLSLCLLTFHYVTPLFTCNVYISDYQKFENQCWFYFLLFCITTKLLSDDVVT